MSWDQRSGRVVAAFPATGKSYLAGTNVCYADSDSSLWQRGPDWPGAYIDHVERMRKERAVVFVSTHAEVRDALVSRDIPYTLIYPNPALRDEYRERMIRRGSPPALVAKVCDELWDAALADCAAQEGCDHIVLGPGEHLADVLEATHA